MGCDGQLRKHMEPIRIATTTNGEWGRLEKHPTEDIYRVQTVKGSVPTFVVVEWCHSRNDALLKFAMEYLRCPYVFFVDAMTAEMALKQRNYRKSLDARHEGRGFLHNAGKTVYGSVTAP